MRQDGSTGEVVQLVANEDYYLDAGLMVLTARYHLRRGYCCEQACRHCPYTEEPKDKSRKDVDSNEEIE
jgi:hypothetical protein